MKKQYIAPVIEVVVLTHQSMICVSGIEGTAGFSKNITDETTDTPLSRRGSIWDDEEEDEEDYY